MISLSSAARKFIPFRLSSCAFSASSSAFPASWIFLTFSFNTDTKKGLNIIPAFSISDARSSSPSSYSFKNRIGASGRRALILPAASTASISGKSQSKRTSWYPSAPMSEDCSSLKASPVLCTRSTATSISSISACTLSPLCPPPNASILEIPLSFQNCRSACPSGIRNSKSTRKILPLSTSLETSMVPPISSTMFFVIAIPSPVPCTLFVVLFSALVKASKILSRYSGVMPYPSSSTSILICSNWLERCPRPIIRNQIFPPAGVYFTALERRLISI